MTTNYLQWQIEHTDEATALDRLLQLTPQSHSADNNGFTVYPGLHVIRSLHASSLRYNILVFLSNDGEFLPPTIYTFRKVRSELYRSAIESDPNIVGPLLQLCNHCLQSTKFKCNHCKLAYYCNTNCQMSDYKLHRSFCKGDSMTGALYFAFDLGEG